MLVGYLSEPEASSASALSVRRLCDGCAPLLASGGGMDLLLPLYRRVQGSGDVAQSNDLDLDEDDVQQVGVGLCVFLGGGRATPSLALPISAERHGLHTRPPTPHTPHAGD
jgi:hypothetical protein